MPSFRGNSRPTTMGIAMLLYTAKYRAAVKCLRGNCRERVRVGGGTELSAGGFVRFWQNVSVEVRHVVSFNSLVYFEPHDETGLASDYIGYYILQFQLPSTITVTSNHPSSSPPQSTPLAFSVLPHPKPKDYKPSSLLSHSDTRHSFPP